MIIYSIKDCLNKKLSYRRERLYRLKYSCTLYCCTYYANRSRDSLRSTFSNCYVYCATCIVLYTHRCTRHNCRIASMQCCACYQPTSVQPMLVSTTTCNEEVKGNSKYINYRFEPPFGGLRGNVHGSSMARWKARGRLPISTNGTVISLAITVEAL